MEPAELDDVDERIAATAARLPECTLSPVAFTALHPNAAELRDERRHELFLTTACLQGDRVALAEFFRRFTPEVRAVARQSLPENEHDDFVQDVLARLLVARKRSPPGAGLFKGQGPLLIFVRITASRCAVDLRRRLAAHAPIARQRDAGTGSQTPERQLVTDEARTKLGEVLAEIMADLAPHERRALRMRYLLGLSVARTARLLQLHERSVSRLVSRITARISRKTIEQLGTIQGASAVGRVALESSIGAWLASRPGDDDG